MKTIKKLLFMAAIAAAFVSCEIPVNGVEFETDLDVNVEDKNNVPGTSSMNVIAAAPDSTFSNEGEVDLNQFEDVKDRLDKIKSMKIKNVIIRAFDFKDVDGKDINSTITNFNLSFPDLGINKTDLAGTSTVLSDIVVSFTKAELTKIQDAILKNKKIKYSVSGTVNSPKYPVSFTIKSKYTVDFKVKLF